MYATPDWNGCICSRCYKKRNEQHDWDLYKGKCKRCGKTQVEQHDWNGCGCSRCGKIRDEQHDWDECKVKCKRCGKAGDEQHNWHGYECARCGKYAFRYDVGGSREHVNVYGEITHIYAWGTVSQGELLRGEVVDVYDKSGKLKFKNVKVVHTRGKGMRPDAYSLPDNNDGGYVSLETYSSHADITIGDIIVPVNFPMEILTGTSNKKKEA